MQTTIYYREKDNYLIEKIEAKASRERKSKSAVILSILEEYFESEQKIGEILRDLGAVSSDKLNRALEVQRTEQTDKKLGEILVNNNYVRDVDLDRALDIQHKIES